ncbi:hypothetical protein [Romboutsia maritimum]|nr:hypothetical protein [Romboutsia maritimum]
MPITMAKLYIKDNNKEYTNLEINKLKDFSVDEVLEFENYVVRFINIEN